MTFRTSIAVIGLVCLIAAVAALAMPAAAQVPCLSGPDCPALLNPELDEYYSVQCTSNALWVWRSVPTESVLTAFSLVQIDALGDGDTLGAPTSVLLTRSGHTLTLSGANGNTAPEPGEKTVSWNVCIVRNGGLPELPGGPVSTPSDEIAECLRSASEQEAADCLAALTVHPAANTCADLFYRLDHPEECVDISETGLGIIFRLVNVCRFPGAFGLVAISFSLMRPRRRKR